MHAQKKRGGGQLHAMINIPKRVASKDAVLKITIMYPADPCKSEKCECATHTFVDKDELPQTTPPFSHSSQPTLGPAPYTPCQLQCGRER